MKVEVSKIFKIELSEDEAKTLVSALQKSYGTSYYERYLDDEEQDIFTDMIDNLAVRCSLWVVC